MKITGKVAKILDNRTLIINVGSSNGVKLGMKFLISSATNSEVKDPDTGQVIGEVAIPKIKVSVTRVDEKYSIAETYEYHTVNEGGQISTGEIVRMFQPPKLVKKYKTFEIEDTQKQSIDQEKSIILVGDIAESIDE